ncbi:MAG: acetamidase/formamidase family protein [Rubrobacter sp.]|nr:acetamidase/formamidase family protein [Rubrobacter sp.]
MPADEHQEAAFELLSRGIGRRDLLKATAAVGAGAVAPAWLLSPGVEDAIAGPHGVERGVESGFDTVGRRSPGRILQPEVGRRVGHYVRSTAETVMWGYLPNAASEPVRTVRSGALVTFDGVSHEGMLEDQGRNPLEYFSAHGVRERDVLRDQRAIAASNIEHDFYNAGPHIVTGPVHVAGAEPGDVLRVDVVGLVPRVPYGVVSSRHGKGALPGEFPQTPPPDPNASPARPELYHNVSIFTPMRRIAGKDQGVMPGGPRHRVVFPIDPFMGIMGVALPTTEPVPSVPPNVGGGNMDIRHFTVGSRAYFPVWVKGAKFFTGDPHFRQGHGEVALTAWEASLRATFRLTLLKKGSKAIPGNRESLDLPFGETAEYWMPVGLNTDLDEAMKQAVRQALDFLHGEFGMPRQTAYAYMSAATDYVVSQVVDRVKGVHGLIRKDHFVSTSSSRPRHAE